MQCPICRTEAPAAPSICPRCGAFISIVPESKPSKIAELVWILLIAFIVLVAAFSLTGFYLLKRGAFDKLRNTNTVRALRGEIAVVHGNVVSATELQGNGKLYFVPMGRQVISAQSLVKHYNKKFNLHITVLPEVAIDASACVAARKQCIAEEMILDMKRAYRKIAVDPDSVMIALTDEDIYPRSLGWDFTYAFHPDYQFGIVSTRRMDPVFWRHPRNDARRLANTWQMLTDYIAFLYFHIPRSNDPTSIMYQPFTPDGGPDDLHESDLHSEESANGRRGKGYPCLTFTYSYDTGEISPWPQFVNDCYENANPPAARDASNRVGCRPICAA